MQWEKSGEISEPNWQMVELVGAQHAAFLWLRFELHVVKFKTQDLPAKN